MRAASADKLLKAVAMLLLSLCGCSSEPPLGAGLPKPAYADDYYFDGRLKLRFPVGSDEQKLIAELRAKRFAIPPAVTSMWPNTGSGVSCVMTSGMFGGRRSKGVSVRLEASAPAPAFETSRHVAAPSSPCYTYAK